MSVYLDNNGTVYKGSAVSSDFTDISFFAKIKIDTNDQYHQIFDNHHSGSFGQGYSFYLTDNADGNVLGLDIAYKAALESALDITDNAWHIVGFTRRASDSVWTIYLDTSSEEVGTTEPYSVDSSARTIIGGWNNNTTVTAEGSFHMCDVGFWERLLSGTEITNITTNDYEVSDISSTNLVLYLPMDDGFFGFNNGGSAGNLVRSGTPIFTDHYFTLPDEVRMVAYNVADGSSSTPTISTSGLGIQSGDLMRIVIHINGPQNSSDNNGSYPFTQHANSSNREYNGPSAQVDTYYRVAGGSEPTSYTFNLDGSNRWCISILALRSADTSTIWDVEPTSTTENSGSGSTSSTDAITINYDNSIVITEAQNDSTSNYYTGFPSGFRCPINESGQQLLGVGYKYFGTAGSQASVDWTQNASNGTWLNNIYAIKYASSITDKSVTDSGSGSDSIGILVLVDEAETGAGVDTVDLLAEVGITDEATGVDATPDILALPEVTDTGSGADDLEVLPSVDISETGTGDDGTPDILAQIPVSEDGTGVDNVDILAEIPVTDTGSGDDSVDASPSVALEDSATGTDELALLVAIELAESGVGVDTITDYRQNLCKNPNFEEISNFFWNTGAYDLSTLYVLKGTYSARCYRDYVAGVAGTQNYLRSEPLNFIPEVGKTYTWSIYVYVPEDSPYTEVELSFRDSSWAKISGQEWVVLTPGQWVRGSITRTCTVADAGGWRLIAADMKTPGYVGTGREYIYYDMALLEAHPSVRTYFDGDTPSDANWLGTPHQSISEISTGIIAMLELAETGSGADVIEALIQIALEDSAVGTETIDILANIVIADSALAVDALDILVTLAISDTATGAEAIDILTDIIISESATGNDAVSVLISESYFSTKRTVLRSKLDKLGLRHREAGTILRRK